MNPGLRTYYAMTLLSVLVATVGLLLDAPAVVVGSMVIAPQIGSALTASVGVAFSRPRMVRNGFRSLVFGLAFGVACATAFGWLLRTADFVPTVLTVSTISQISARTSPGLLTLVVGVCAGGAGAFGLSTDLPVSLVGVAVAAALVPAAAAVGIGLAWGFPVVALGAFVLLVVNVLSITVSGTLVLWYLGYRPRSWEESSRFAAVRSGDLNATVVALAAVVLVTVVVGGVVARQSGFENTTNEAIASVLEDPRYDRLELLSSHVSFGDFGLLGATREVTVRLRRPTDVPYPTLSARLESRVAAATGTNVSVTVEFVERQNAGVAPDRRLGTRSPVARGRPRSRRAALSVPPEHAVRATARLSPAPGRRG